MDIETDCQIFFNAFKELGGNDNSLTDTNCCSWKPQNIVCSDSKIFQISLDNKILPNGGRLSSQLTKLTLLQTLQLTDIGLNGNIPQFNQSFAAFLLGGNKLSGTIPTLSFIRGSNELGIPYFNLKNNYFGANDIPPLLAAQQFRDCPFDNNMCSYSSVLSCPNVTFTCTPNILNQTSSAGGASNGILFGLSSIFAYIVGGLVLGFLVLGSIAFGLCSKRFKLSDFEIKREPRQYMSTDCPAFYNLFKSLGGNDPTLTTTNCCSWEAHKVVCSGDRIIQIKLELMGLDGTVSSDIGKLTGLKLFSLASNKITGELPPEITIPKYAVFDVDDNNFYGSIPALTFDTNFNQYYAEFYKNGFNGNVPDSIYSANITVNGKDNGGCPFDSNLCVKSPPLGCANVVFTCTSVPHRFAVATPTANSTIPQSNSGDGFFSHTGNVLALAAGALVLIAAVVGVSLLVFAKKKQVDDLKSANSPQTSSAIHNFVGQQANQFQNEGGYTFDPVSGSPITTPQYIPGQPPFVQPPNPAFVPSSPSLQSTNISNAILDQNGNAIGYQPQQFLTTINGQQFIATIQPQPLDLNASTAQSPALTGNLPSRSSTLMTPDTPTVNPQFATLGSQPRHNDLSGTLTQQPRHLEQAIPIEEPRLAIEQEEETEKSNVDFMPPTIAVGSQSVEMMPPTIPNNFLAEMNELRNRAFDEK
ncbi:hypothetical protein HDV01_006494 [Terramyces sp. JEL0728]|nr:hypothetical protein HDV01_006494 [Terramyces sp. JEL0728]